MDLRDFVDTKIGDYLELEERFAEIISDRELLSKVIFMFPGMSIRERFEEERTVSQTYLFYDELGCCLGQTHFHPKNEEETELLNEVIDIVVRIKQASLDILERQAEEFLLEH
jgi:hypothetical protein